MATAGTASAGAPSGGGRAGAAGASGADASEAGQGGSGDFGAGGTDVDAAGAGGADDEPSSTAGDGGSNGGGSGGAPQVRSCGAEAGSDGTGTYADVTARYSAATAPERAPTLDGSAELHAEHSFEGTLEATDAPFIRVTDSCGQPPPGYTYTVDVFAVELVGPGPHDLVVDTCASELVFSGKAYYAIDTVVMAYQDDEGSAHPLDLDDACPHLLAQADDGCSNHGGPSLLRMAGLREGTVQIAVTTFGGPPTTPWPYVLRVRSSTSCE